MGSLSRRSQVRTNGPQMANATIEVYQEHRAVKRSRDSEHFPGDINEETMRVDENDILFTFIREDHRVATRDTYEYGSHVGMPVFSCLNGIDMDRYEFMKSAKVVGVAKSHTVNDDKGPSGVTEFAAFIGGTFTIINNGTKLIPMQTEIMVMIYDKLNNPGMFKKLFEEYDYAGYRGGEDIRILGVVEPYEKSQSLVDTIRRFGKAKDYIVEADENLRGEAGQPKFGIAEKVEVMEDGLADLLVLGAAIFATTFTGATGITADPGGQRAAAIADFTTYVRNQLIAADVAAGVAGVGGNAPRRFKNALVDFRKVLKGTITAAEEPLRHGLYRAITMKNTSERFANQTDIDTPGFDATIHGIAVNSQLGLRKLYSGLKGAVMWEREWIIGKSTKTAAPGDALDLIIRR